MKCPVCAVEVSETANYCAHCGARLPTHFGRSAAGGPPPTPPSTASATPSAAASASSASPAPNATQNNSPTQTAAASQFRNQLTSGLNDPNDLHHVLWEGRYSPKAMMGVWIGLGIFSILVLLGGAIWARSGLWWSLLLATILLSWAYAAMVYSHRHWGIRYQLTTQRFYHERGILRHVSDRIEVIAMDDITVTQGPLDRLFAAGQIRILSSDHATPEFVIDGVADVKKVAMIIDEARRAERNRRGVRVESI